MVRWGLGVALALAGCLMHARVVAQAPPPVTQLRFQRAPGAARCPDEAKLRAAVTQQLGRDPFVGTPFVGTAGEASQRLVGNIAPAPAGRGFVARVHLERAGQRLGARQLDVPERNCAGMLEALSLVVSLMLQGASDAGKGATVVPATAADTGKASGASAAGDGTVVTGDSKRGERTEEAAGVGSPRATTGGTEAEARPARVTDADTGDARPANDPVAPAPEPARRPQSQKAPRSPKPQKTQEAPAPSEPEGVADTQTRRGADATHPRRAEQQQTPVPARTGPPSLRLAEAGAVGIAGVMPDWAVGPALALQRWLTDRLSLRASATWLPTGRVPTDLGHLRFAVFHAELALCADTFAPQPSAALALCAGFGAGAMRGSAHGFARNDGVALRGLADLTGGARFRWLLSRPLWLVVGAELRLPMRRPRFGVRVGGEPRELHRVAVVGAALSVSLALQLGQ